jgi:hypothetical protein
MHCNAAALAKSASQTLAIVCMAAILAVVAHNGYTDISALAEQYSGKEFWTRLGRYFLANLAGG